MSAIWVRCSVQLAISITLLTSKYFNRILLKLHNSAVCNFKVCKYFQKYKSQNNVQDDMNKSYVLKIFEWLSIFSFTACIQSNKNPIANNDSSENYKSTFWHFAVHTTHTITGVTFICTILSTEWLSIPKFEYTYYHSSIHSPFYISDKLLFCSMFYL